MRVTGHDFRTAIKFHLRRRELFRSELAASWWAFPAEEKRPPEDISTDLRKCEIAIATLQTAQTLYNATVELEVSGAGTRSLLYCIKAVGGAGRLEKLWTSAAKDDGREDRWSRRTLSRQADETHATKTVSRIECNTEIGRYERQADAFRRAIAEGNLREMEINVDPSLFPE